MSDDQSRDPVTSDHVEDLVQAVLLAPFLMRFRLGARTFGGEVGTRLHEAVRRAVPEFVVQDSEPDSPLLFDYHVSTGGSRLSGKKTVGTVEIPDAGRWFVRFDPTGICHMMHDVDVADRDTLHSTEREMVYVLNPHVKRWVDAISEELLDTGLVVEAEEDAMDPGMLLWWHRVLVDPPRDEEPAATRTYGVEKKIHDNALLRFGDGFTTLVDLPTHRLGDVMIGEIAASMEWIAVDEANRLLSARLRVLDEARWNRVEDLDKELKESLQLSKNLALREMVRLEESRYVVNASGVVVAAAEERYNMDRERASVETQLQTLRDSLDFHRTILQTRRDERRNQLLSVVTIAALFQAVLVWYDFVHEGDNTLGPALRLTVAGSTAVLLAVFAASALLRGRQQD
ncbi:hypothetical protein ACTWP5_03335 [Streptomyces sp. 4N509B]|uniref:hypothetical protein n=1 Tax=Streptomyces sp. 4N509B TaxID=3457413 RepID=UPI003FD5D18C